MDDSRRLPQDDEVTRDVYGSAFDEDEEDAYEEDELYQDEIGRGETIYEDELEEGEDLYEDDLDEDDEDEY